MRRKAVREMQKVVNLQATAGAKGNKLFGSFSDLKQKISQSVKNAIAVIVRNQSNDYYFFGEYDNLPNTIITAVDNSGTATACIGRLEQFIKADGFIDPLVNAAKANKHQTLAAVLDEISTNISYLNGFALRLIFDNIGQVKKIYNVPIKTLRRKGDHFEYNPLMGELGKIEGETRFYPEYDPERSPRERMELIANQVAKHGEQLGEILYVFKKGMGRYYDIYPVPRYYAAIEDLISDGKISRLDLRNITQGFRTPVIISTGPIDDKHKDEEGNTAQDYFDEALEDFSGENASPILHLKGNTEEFKPTITTIDIAQIMDQTDASGQRIAKRVARVMEVPDVLIGMSKEGQLGNVQEVKNQMALFALTIYQRQDMIKQAFDQIKPILSLEGLPINADFTISTLKPFDYVPDAVIANLTTEEQKELFELEFKNAQSVAAIEGQTNSTLANLTGRQLQGIQRLVRKYNKEELTYDQAAQMLSSGFGMSEEEVHVWLITKEEEEI